MRQKFLVACLKDSDIQDRRRPLPLARAVLFIYDGALALKQTIILIC